MDKSPALSHAPSEPLPELDEFLKPFHTLFRRRARQTAMERYLTGLLTEHPAKNCVTLADIIPGTNEQQLQGLLTQMVWDEIALNQPRVQIMCALPTEGDGILIIDDTGFAKQGQPSTRWATALRLRVCPWTSIEGQPTNPVSDRPQKRTR